MVPSSYDRLELHACASTGAMLQWPPSRQSSSLPKQLSASMVGMQHQSIEPLRPTSAADSQSLISA
jgi:hypothetical protein